MNVLIVYAHHEPTSFTSAMKNLAFEVLGSQKHDIVISDLYGQGFSPAAQRWDFFPTPGNNFKYLREKKHAMGLKFAFSPVFLGEILKLPLLGGRAKALA